MFQPLAVDNGTQSLKALVFDLAGELVAKEAVPIPLYSSPQPGWAEQDPEDFWRALCAALHALWRNRQVDKARIAGMAVTAQRGTVISVDKAGNPLIADIALDDFFDGMAHCSGVFDVYIDYDEELDRFVAQLEQPGFLGGSQLMQPAFLLGSSLLGMK